MLVGTELCLRSDGLRVPGGNPPVWLCDHCVEPWYYPNDAIWFNPILYQLGFRLFSCNKCVPRPCQKIDMLSIKNKTLIKLLHLWKCLKQQGLNKFLLPKGQRELTAQCSMSLHLTLLLYLDETWVLYFMHTNHKYDDLTTLTSLFYPRVTSFDVLQSSNYFF